MVMRPDEVRAQHTRSGQRRCIRSEVGGAGGLIGAGVRQRYREVCGAARWVQGVALALCPGMEMLARMPGCQAREDVSWAARKALPCAPGSSMPSTLAVGSRSACREGSPPFVVGAARGGP